MLYAMVYHCFQMQKLNGHNYIMNLERQCIDFGCLQTVYSFLITFRFIRINSIIAYKH